MTEIAVAPAVAAERRRQPRTFDGALLLSGATVASGVLAYAYHVLAARILGPEAYGLVAVLWAALFLLVVVLFRPLEQTTSRAFADRLARGQEIRSVLRAMLRIYLVLAAGIAVVGALGWDVVREQLFLGDSFYVAALLLGLAAYGVAYVMRGVCAGVGLVRRLRAAPDHGRRHPCRGRPAAARRRVARSRRRRDGRGRGRQRGRAGARGSARAPFAGPAA